MFDENKQLNMTELVFMATELVIRDKAEEKGLDKKIKDQQFYDHIIKNLTSYHMMTMFVLDKFNEESGMDSKESTEKANEKAMELVFKIIQDLADALESKEEVNP
jgi:heterodisulfide reductase subunit C